MYGPNGTRPLLPGPQPPPFPGQLKLGSTNGVTYVEVVNPGGEAVDMEGWALEGSLGRFRFLPGACVGC